MHRLAPRWRLRRHLLAYRNDSLGEYNRAARVSYGQASLALVHDLDREWLLHAELALLLPSRDRSQATIHVEQQEFPRETVRSTLTSLADQRIQRIRRRVMTGANRLEAMPRYRLFAEQRRLLGNERVVEPLRDSMAIKEVSADVVVRAATGPPRPPSPSR